MDREKAVIEALASMNLDNLSVSPECIEKAMGKDKELILVLKKEEKEND